MIETILAKKVLNFTTDLIFNILKWIGKGEHVNGSMYFTILFAKVIFHTK
jgi:hypothetical protein